MLGIRREWLLKRKQFIFVFDNSIILALIIHRSCMMSTTLSYIKLRKKFLLQNQENFMISSNKLSLSRWSGNSFFMTIVPFEQTINKNLQIWNFSLFYWFSKNLFASDFRALLFARKKWKTALEKYDPNTITNESIFIKRDLKMWTTHPYLLSP